jgi:hypothetical protein
MTGEQFFDCLFQILNAPVPENYGEALFNEYFASHHCRDYRNLVISLLSKTPGVL